jgi:3-hydroxyisobutyrate dehydrogenase-like beta-hydroxyacid dehydrogenase
MGGSMALHLIEAGHDVAVWSHNKNKVETMAAKGGIACATPAEVAKQSDYIFLCVGNTEMSREVILGKDGLEPVMNFVRASPLKSTSASARLTSEVTIQLQILPAVAPEVRFTRQTRSFSGILRGWI